MQRTTKLAPVAASPATKTFDANAGCCGRRKPIAKNTISHSITSFLPVGTSNRQGAVSVTQIEIMPKPPVGHNPNTPWPQWPMVLKTSSSHEEGCERRWLLTTNKFIGTEDGRVCGAEVEEVEWQPNPEGGRPLMVPTTFAAFFMT